MPALVLELRKHLFIYLLLVKNSLIAQMEFRSNFFVAIGLEVVFVIVRLAYLFVIYQNGIVLAGIPPSGMLLFLGSFYLVTGLFNGLFLGNIFDIPDHVGAGTLDLLMTKPISLQFYLTLRRVNFVNPLPMLVGGAAMVIIGWRHLHIPFTAGNLTMFTGYLAGGATMSYAIYLAVFLLSFWIVRVGSLYVFFDNTWDLNSIPMNSYNRWIKWMGVFLLPIFMISNFPASYLLGKLNFQYEVWGIVAPILALILVRLFWKAAIRSYSGASS